METPENQIPPETPENQIPPETPEKTTPPSLLDQIIKTANDPTPQGATTTPTEGIPTSPTGNTPSGSNIPPIKKPRDPMTAGMVMKLIGSLLIVAVIFFGSFLAYIAFNPEQAGFFVNIFSINPNDIQNILKKLINGSFGIIVLLLSIVWIISLFRAIWTPRDQKRRRLLSWIVASIVGIFLFSILALWAFLFKIINETPYDNPGGDVMIYDNDLYTHSESRDYARISNTQNIVGPITLKYDLSTNAKAIAKKNLLTIDSYSINFDKAKCITESAIVTGSDPSTEQGLICTFDEIRPYMIVGTYTGRDRAGKTTTIDIPLSTVEIKGLVEISTNTNTEGKKIRTINASKVKNLGTPRWRYSTSSSTEIAKSSITETISNTPILVCLVLFKNTCDRTFIITDNDTETELNTGKGASSLSFERDPTNPLNVSMTLSGVLVNKNEIVSIDWVTNDNSSICQGIQSTCEYTFSSYGTKVVTATILLASKKIITVQGTIILNKPIFIIRHVQVLDKDNNLLNTEDTFDKSLGAYVLKDIKIPAKLSLDARDIVLENSGYKMKNVKWRISNSKTTEEKVGEQVDIELLQTLRYTIEATYTFDKNLVNNETESFTARDMIIIDLDRKPLEPVLTIQQSSDYAPAKITVDASSSQSKNGSIQKFLFDFGEGRPQAEGDAIQTYEYKTSGEKKITLTIIDDNNEKATISKYVVLKDTPKSLTFTTSMSPGIIGMPVDLIADGATGDIEEWIWNFGDNTPVGKGYEISHTYNKIGSYTITLTVRYIDGTEKSTSQNLKIENMQ